MKQCGKCRIEKGAKEFVKGKNCCLSCRNAYQRNYYLTHPEWKNSKIKCSKDRKKTIRAFLKELKDNKPCVDCGVSYPYFVMDFDHLKDKRFCLANAASGTPTDKRILEELSKTELVCSNCHRRRTHERKTGTKQK